MNTATCVDESERYVKQMVFAFRPMNGIKGALGDISGKSGVSYWKLRKLWNRNLRQYGFTLEADEHRSLKELWFAYLSEQETQCRARLDEIRRLREQRQSGGECQHEIDP